MLAVGNLLALMAWEAGYQGQSFKNYAVLSGKPTFFSSVSIMSRYMKLHD